MQKTLIRRGGAWLVLIAMLLSLLPASALAAEAEGNTIYTDSTMTVTGDGSSAKPFQNFEDALAAAKDGDTIAIRGKATLSEKQGAAGIPCVIDKSITIEPADNAGTASFQVRTAGIVLGADVNILNIELNFENRYHNAIFANGHRFTAINVTRGSGSREVHLFGGTIGKATGLSFTAASGTDATFTLDNSEFGNIYAGSIADSFTSAVNVDLTNSKAIGTIYGSGAQELTVGDDWFDTNEPAAPTADTQYTAGDAAVTVDGSTALTVHGAGAKSMNVIVRDGKNYPLTLNDVTALTAQGGKVKIASINANASVSLSNDAVLDLSGAATGTDVHLLTLAGSGKLILGKDHLLTIDSSMSGTFTLETPGYTQGTSGVAEYDHTYINVKLDAENATVNFIPHSTQSTMSLEKIGNTWKTTAEPAAPTTVSDFQLNQSGIAISADDLAQTGLMIPVTWESSQPDSELKSLSYIPFRYQIEYDGKTYGGTAAKDSDTGMYSLHLSFDGKYMELQAGDAIEQDDLPDRIDLYSNIPAGSYSITIYAPKGDGTEIQQTLTLRVTDGAQIDSSVTLSVDNTTVAFGAKPVLTATVTPDDATGTVQFYVNDTALGALVEVKNGTAVMDTLAATPANGFQMGSNTLRAVYSGDAGYRESTSQTISVTVEKVTPAVSVTATDKGVGTGTVELNASLVGGDNVGYPPTGNFVFTWDGTVVATVPASSGAATYTVTGIAAGTHTYKAEYVPAADDPYYNGAVSGEKSITTADSVTADLKFRPENVAAKTATSKYSTTFKWDEATKTITLLQDATITEPMLLTGFTGGVTLNLNGHTLTENVRGANQVKYEFGLILQEGSVVTITGNGTLKNDNGRTVYMESGSALTLENGIVQGKGAGSAGIIETAPNAVGDRMKITVKGGQIIENCAGSDSYCLFVSNTDVVMTGGELKAIGSQGELGYGRGIRAMSGAHVTVTGGQFTDLYGPAITTYGADVTAELTGMTLQSNYRAVEARSGSTITLTSCNVSQTESAELTELNNNHEYANAIQIWGATVILKDTTVTGSNSKNAAINADKYDGIESHLQITGGSVSSTGKNAMELYDHTTAVVTNAAVSTTSGYAAIYADNGTDLTVSGGSVDAPNNNTVSLFNATAKFQNATITNTGTGWAGIFANQGSDITMTGGSVSVQDSCGLWIKGASTVNLTNAEITNQSPVDATGNAYAAVYLLEGSTLTANGGSIKAEQSGNAICLNDVATEGVRGSAELTNVTVSNPASTWHAIYAGQNNDLTISGGTVTAGTAGNAVRGYQASVTVKDQATLVGSGVNETLRVNTESRLHVTNSTIRNGASDGIYVGEGSNGTVTETTVEVQQGYGIRAVGSDTANAAATLTGNKVTVQDGMALYAENGTITVNSGTYYAKNNFAMTGTAPYSFIITGGYFHGSADTLEATRADGTKLTLPAGKVLRSDDLTEQERTDNVLGADYWWRLADPAPVKHTLHFDVNGGAAAPAFPDQQVEVGGKPTKPADDPRKLGYVFQGWKNGNDLVDWDTFTMPDADVTFTAAWELGTYTIHFDKNLADATGTMDDQTYKFDDSLGATLKKNTYESPTKNFLGWAMESGAQTPDYTDEAAISDALKAELDSLGTVTLYAIWEDKPAADVTVTFDVQTNGGQFADGKADAKTQTGKAGEALTLPDVQERLGFNFTGWWTEATGGTKITEPAVIPAANTTYYAQWTEKAVVEVTFDSGDGIWNDDTTDVKQASVKPGFTATIPGTVSRTGYTFDGWQSDNTAYRDLLATDEKTPEIQEGQAVHYTPKWKANTYIIHFNANGQADTEGTVADQAYSYDTPNAVLTDLHFTSPTKKFLGWSLETTATTAAYQPGGAIDAVLKAAMVDSTDGSITLYAVWTDLDAVTMTFSAGEGTFADGSNEKMESVLPGQQNALPAAPTRDGYLFVGWASSDAAYPDLASSAAQTPAGIAGKNVTYTAKWEKLPVTEYTVTFQSGSNGSFTTPNDPLASQTVEDGKSVTGVPAITANSSYTFSGWQIDGAGTVYTTEQVKAMPITENTTFVATYAPVAKYTVTFQSGSNGSFTTANDPLASQTVEDGKSVTGVPAITANSSYTFSGWQIDGAGTVYTTEQVKAMPITEDTTFVAAYAPVAKYTVTFQSGSNGSFTTANDPLASQTVEDGKSVTGVPAITANSSYTFNGWQIDGAGTVYTGAQVMAMAITKDTVFVANYTYTGGSSGGGGSTTTSLVIKASAGNGGSINPSGNVSVVRGGNKTFTISAADGFEIADVLVDGKSVGTVSEYTFTNVKENHTITVSFRGRGGVEDPDTTGVSTWLNTKDHTAFMVGYDNGNFGPGDHVTRAQVAQMFYRLLNDQNVTITRTFGDVSSDAWYAKAVNTLASLNIVAGIGDGKFDPDRAITRAEFTAIAARFAKASNVGELSFVDVPANAWYRDAVLTAVNYGWITGVGDNRFAPQALITRAEAATIVNRMLKRSADEKFVDSGAVRQFPDVSKNHWAYYQVMEASNSHGHRTDASGKETWTGLE